MKMLSVYKDWFECENEDQVFRYLSSTFKEKLLTWTYFVNWEKVLENVKEIELSLNTLNYLLGKPDFEIAFKYLVKKNPEVVQVLPALVVRDGENTKKFNILIDYSLKRLVYEDFDFTKTNISDDDVAGYLLFMKETGIRKLIESKNIKNLVDYMIGVEAGLDSNARKNRSGSIMENIVESFIADFCKNHGYEYISQAKTSTIKKRFGYDVPIDKATRIYDFVINTGKQLYIFETNFYGGGGSKLKSTAGEYIGLQKRLRGKFPLIWVTDGAGWQSTLPALHDAFREVDYVINLGMLEHRILEEIVK